MKRSVFKTVIPKPRAGSPFDIPGVVTKATTEDYIANRANHAREGAFAKVLDRVPKREPIAGDERINKPSNHAT